MNKLKKNHKEEVLNKKASHKNPIDYKNTKNIFIYKFLNIKFVNINYKIIFILWSLILINTINCILSQKTKKINRNLQNSNIITLTIIGNEYKNIGSHCFPDNIFINDIETTIEEYETILTKETNIIKMIWNKKLDNCSNFFENSSAIEIDLSEFDTSEVTSMQSMFEYCPNLKYINFGNINTSKVNNMAYMFSECHSLTSIDLSKLDTSEVTTMEGMFKYCFNLKYINFGNIISKFDTSKVQSMDFMFFECSSLLSLNLSSFKTSELTTMQEMFFNLTIKELDLSRFDTSKVTNMLFVFSNCQSLIHLNLNNFNTSKVDTMKGLFTECVSLKSLDISKIDTSLVVNMEQMFYRCLSLVSLDLSNFNTSKVLYMDKMFALCTSLIDLNLNTFNTENTYTLSYMFSQCIKLESLDLSSFAFNQIELSHLFFGCSSLTSIKFSKEYKLVDYVDYMFYECSSLTYLDLYNFDFGIIDSMEFLFYDCASLTSIDLEYFDTFSVANMDYMFYGCNSLISLNLEYWITSSLVSIKAMFYDCTSLISLDLSNFDTSSVINMKETFYNCIRLTSLNLINFNTTLVSDMESMFYGCSSLLSLNLSSFATPNVNNMKSMFYNCNKLRLLDLSNFNTQKVINMESMFFGCQNLAYINFKNFNNESLENLDNIFSEVPDNLIICINNIEEILYELYKLKCSIADCSSNWKENKKRIIYNNGSCVDRCQNIENKNYEYEFFCYDECPKGTHSSKNNTYICEKSEEKCIENYPFIIIENNLCTKTCSSEDFFSEKCSLNNENSKSKEIIIEHTTKEIENGLMDNIISEVINKQKDYIVKNNDTIYQITSSFNQNNNIYKNISSIKLGECESIIKEIYEISIEAPLIIFKIEKNIEDILIPLIEYEIFSPKEKIKLDLNYCKEKKKNINIHIPVSININESDYYKYNPNNFYYNNICNLQTTEYGTDIVLYDRKKEYNDKNLSLCHSNCKYIDYSFDNNVVICQCDVQAGIQSNSYISLYKFNNTKNFLNLNVLKCIKLVYTKEGLIKNIGNYILLPIIILFIISGIYFYSKEHKKIINQIDEMLDIKKTIDDSYSKKEVNFKGNIKVNLTGAISPPNKNKKIIKKFILKKKSENNLSKENINQNENLTYEDFEINNISYEHALERDERTYCQYYLSLIKQNHLLIFSFNNNKDYNPYIIKICLFFFLFALNIFINTLFFNDSTMHKIYEDKGIFNFIYVLPYIIYSIIIASIFNTILRGLYLPQKDILKIKYEKNIDFLNAKVSNVIKCLNIKFICFFLINLLFLIFFWLYLSSFCYIYRNTQIYLFKVVSISYSFSFLYPFIIYLLPGIFRISSLREPEKCIYKISKIIQLL